MSEAYIGTIMPWAPNFAPSGWMFCQGQTLPIAQYQALFSLISTAYGGDGRTNFQLPDLRGRVPVGAGRLSGTGTEYIWSKSGGMESTTLKSTQIAPHSHPAGSLVVNSTFTATPSVSLGVSVDVSVPATNDSNLPATNTPANNCVLGVGVDNQAGAVPEIYRVGSPNTSLMKSTATGTATGNITVNGKLENVPVTGNTGVNQVPNPQEAVPILQPYVVVNYIICVNGLYPTRD
ncbi:MAG: tail fiber protein [Clostridia bacterium]|nr:tail fiber protein [Clostridia bacterium]